MASLFPLAVMLAGAGLALGASRLGDLRPGVRLWGAALWGWGLGTALFLSGLGLEFGTQGMPDHAAMAYAAGLALLLGQVPGLLILRLSAGNPAPSALGLAMTLGLPPFGAFAGLWLGLQAVQAALLLLPPWPALAIAALGLATLAGWIPGWKAGARLRQEPARPGGWGLRLLVALAALGAFLPWVWVLPAQIAAAWLTGELPTLLVALGLMLSPVIPDQASVIPFGLLAVAMALSSVLLLVLRLTRRSS